MEEDHLTPESIAQIASKAYVKKVLMTHLLSRFGNADPDYGDLVARVRAGFSGEVVAAKDLDHF